jgi:lipoprotein-anchoring transpeptidase ErfK/SrfK
MITLKKFSSLLSAISTSVEYSEIVRTTFVGAFTDLSTALNELGADWDYTGIGKDYSTMYDIHGTYEGSEFRIYVTCFFPI